MKRSVILLLIALLNIFPAIAEENTGDNEPVIHIKTPQELLTAFTRYMISGTGKGASTQDLARALTLIQPHLINGKAENKSNTLDKADDLIFLLNTVNYNPEDAKLIGNDGRNAVIEIGDENSTVRLAVTRDPDRGWIFSDLNFTDPQFNDAFKHIENVRNNVEKYADQFIPELSSPLNTLYTFTYGVQNLHGYDMDDAVAALNLSDLDPKVAAGLGPTWAIQSYRMLHYASTVKPETLSNNPLYEDKVVLLLDPNYGMISMSCLTDKESGKKAWKIEYDGNNSINAAYDSFMKHGMASELHLMGIRNPTLHIRLDDFFQQNLPILENKFLGINIWKIIMCLLLILSSFIILPLIRIICLPLIKLITKLLNISGSQNTTKRFILPLQIIIMSMFWLKGIVIISASPSIMAASIVALNIIKCLTLTLLLCRFIDSACSVAAERFSTSLHIITNVMGKILKIAAVIMAILYICDIFNLNTTNFLAALGIGGFAFALAGKDTIENFFGSIMIIMDRPFRNGDYIKIGDISGVIEQVGVRSTTIRTLTDTIVTIPNRMFISSTIENLGMRKWRRYNTSFDILYETDIDRIKIFTDGLTELAHLMPDTKKDEIQIYFYSLGSCSLEIFINLYFRNRGRIEELKAREKFNTQALRLAQRLGIEFAYPTQKLYVQQENQPYNPLAQVLPEPTSDKGGKVSAGVTLAREISPYYKEPEITDTEAEAK